MKKEIGLVLGVVLLFSMFSASVIAAESDDNYADTFNELEEEYAYEEINPGITPDSPIYFLDGFFGDSREEKIAEVEAMIAQGDFESARKALSKYNEQAKKFEEDPDPEKRAEARRAAAAISRLSKKIKDAVPEDKREEFYDDVLDTEGGIITAVEISSKIKELCEQLAEVDPMEYSKMCKTDDDAPKWQKELDKDLSVDQEKIAREFVDVMKQCFKTSGKDCACDEIPFYDFSVACSKAAPLAVACDGGNEISCDELENLDMPDLPEWLEPTWEELEGGMNEAQYEMHMPPECVEEGVTAPKECGKVMIKTHAPLECKAALLEADTSSEKEGREICDEIMFKLHTPQECIDKGLTGPDECSEFMDNFMGDDFGPVDGGSGFGLDCSGIEDSTERLDCYDNKANEVGAHYGLVDGEVEGEITWQCKENRIHWPPDCETFMREEWPEQEKMKMEEGEARRAEEGDWRVKEKECVEKCEGQGKPWTFTGGDCQCGEAGQYYNKERGFYDESECKDGCEDECGNQNTDCVNDMCVCLGGGDDDEEESGSSDGDSGGDGEPESNSGDGGESSDGETGESESSESESSDSGEDSSGGDDGGSESSNDDAGITGNAFLDYYWD